MTNTSHKLLTYLEEIQDPRKNVLISIYNDHKQLFHQAAGSSNNHQAWLGGYGDHIAECLMINDATYEAFSALRPLPFSKDSAAIALFFHDIEKPFKNIRSEDARVRKWQARKEETAMSWEEIKWEIIEHLKAAYNFTLTEEEINALKYTHGEGDDYTNKKRTALPLAAHVHHCDNTSARIWFDQGRDQRQDVA